MIPKNSLPRATAPPEIWARIQSELDAPKRSRRWWWVLAPVAAMLVAVLWIALRPNDWIETKQDVTTLSVGNIGTVAVQPNSRVRFVARQPNEYRLELAHGAIEAEINAPPRLFIVDTPATRAIDLGCAYRMETDSSGNGSLRVTGGWVALERKESGEVLVPAGASCKIRSGRGPGTPYFGDASEAFRAALDEFDASGRVQDELLLNARVRDTLTLWHVRNAVQGSDRERVFDRMAALVPPPKGMAIEKAFTLEELAWHW